MSFQPSRYSYGSWIDDAEAWAAGKVASTRSDVEGAAVVARAAANVNALAARQAAQDAATAAAAPALAAAAAAKKAADDADKAIKWLPWLAAGALGLGGWWIHSRNRHANPAGGTAQRWLLLGGTVAGATGAALTTAGAATLQPEVLALSGPLMVAGAVMIGTAGALDKATA